jgi:2-polyprenyl-3-methyl-5-hydroxy-6-metoxy-1,4-benzoquinol methylase
MGPGKTDFDAKSAGWDEDPGRVRLAGEVAASIIRVSPPSHDMNVLDFGCGTGLVTLKLQPLVKRITGVDSSTGMLEVLHAKVKRLGISNVVTQHADLEEGGSIEGSFDLIVSSMALHHVAEPSVLIRRLTNLLEPGGQLTIADLDTEDGSYHPDNTGVHHHGFDRAELKQLFRKSGLHDVRDVTAATVTKDREETGKREYSVFLVTGRK